MGPPGGLDAGAVGPDHPSSVSCGPWQSEGEARPVSGEGQVGDALAEVGLRLSRLNEATQGSMAAVAGLDGEGGRVSLYEDESGGGQLPLGLEVLHGKKIGGERWSYFK